MVKQELIKRSPIRILEKSTHGGVKQGTIGIIAARKGIGKTACLVHIATDQLFQGKHVIHVSFSENTSHIINWYEDIFNKIAKRCKLDNAMGVHDELIRNRIIMNFIQDGIHITEIERSIVTLIESGHFSADTLVIDGYNFSRSSVEELQKFKKFATDLSLALWFSASLDDNVDTRDGSAMPDILKGLLDEIAIVISLQPRENYIHLNLMKDRDSETIEDLHLKLDPEILLIAEEEEH